MVFLTNKNHAMEIFLEPPKKSCYRKSCYGNSCYVRRGLAVFSYGFMNLFFLENSWFLYAIPSNRTYLGKMMCFTVRMNFSLKNAKKRVCPYTGMSMFYLECGILTPRNECLTSVLNFSAEKRSFSLI